MEALKVITKIQDNRLSIQDLDKFNGSLVEVIILPLEESFQKTGSWNDLYKNSFLYFLMTHPIPLQVNPLSREEIYSERFY